MEQRYDAIEFTTRTSVPRLIFRIAMLMLLFTGAYVGYLWAFDMFQTPLRQGGILVFFVLQIVQIMGLTYVMLTWFCWYYEITEKEVIIRKGVIMQTRKYYSLEKIESVTVQQGIIGRIFSFGDIELMLYYSDAPIKISLKYIPKPRRYEKLLQHNLREFGEEDSP